jgi:hypothetical protein
MPRYFFHMIDGRGRWPDDEGSDYPNLEVAYLEAWTAALEMSFEMLRRRDDPYRHRFEIAGVDGGVLADLDFSEVLRPRGQRPPPSILAGRAKQQSDRGRRLVAEINDEVAAARQTLERTRAVLARSRA